MSAAPPLPPAAPPPPPPEPPEPPPPFELSPGGGAYAPDGEGLVRVPASVLARYRELELAEWRRAYEAWRGDFERWRLGSPAPP